jgi:ABC-2 type transport system ATP-binding protein
MSETIRTVDLKKRFRRLNAVDGLNLTVQEGSIYTLVGPNGAGKTTTIKILMNILEPTSGQAEVLGRESKKIAGRAFTDIGYVSENQEIPEWMRVNALLAYLRPFYPNWDRELEGALIKQFDLPVERKVRELSRGMKMKVALASALAYHPKLIVLDEPFGGLDPLVRDELVEALLERATEATVFLSSHDLAEIESFASHVGYMEQGRLRFSEEMTTLAARFREVELTLEGPRALPEKLPKTWLHVKASGGVVRFVESAFDQERTNAEIGNVFGVVHEATFRAMTLRAIFVAMARAGTDA